jgi:hypothetical protein
VILIKQQEHGRSRGNLIMNFVLKMQILLKIFKKYGQRKKKGMNEEYELNKESLLRMESDVK